VIAWMTISDDVLTRGRAPEAEAAEHCTHCAVAGTPLRETREPVAASPGMAAEPARASAR